MPRQGVPYPSREICSLKCQIDALNAKINELMKSINGVQGDGQGNVSLVSGDPAVVINNDQAQHEIKIALDSSQLPAAAVSSVNGQTGVVDLDAADIPMYPGQSTPTVQNAVAANSGGIGQLQSDLNQEVLDRGNADAALQTNVNGIGARVSVIEAQISEDPDPNTIALRGASGRLKAEDPASGATDKTLVTSNWVSQTGDSAPNNLVHRTSDESITGIKYMMNALVGFTTGGSGRAGTGTVIGIYKMTKYSSFTATAVVSSRYNVGMVWAEFAVDNDDNVTVISNATSSVKTAGTIEFVAFTDTDGVLRLGLRYTGSNVGADIHIQGVYANAGRPQSLTREYMTMNPANIVGIAGVFVA